MAPDFVRGYNLREEPFLLLLGAVMQDRGPGEILPNDVEAVRRAGTRHFFREDRALCQSCAKAAIFDRPIDAGPVSRMKLTVPVAAEQVALFLILGLKHRLSPARGKSIGEPSAQAAAELFLGRAVVEIHASAPLRGSGEVGRALFAERLDAFLIFGGEICDGLRIAFKFEHLVERRVCGLIEQRLGHG